MCEFCKKCWRFSYSKYYIEKEKYIIPPERQILFLSGYASIDIMPRKGIYCENMPCQNYENNLCPYLQNGNWANCHERQKELKRVSKQKEKFVKFPNSEKRLKLPADIRRQVAANANYKCVYCNRPHNGVDFTGRKIQCVVDHIVPLALGGDPLSLHNLCFACKDCNQAKSTDIWQSGCRRGFYGS
jgi:5-methylcytosine-specific restriction endonuclease McrA